MSSIAFGISSSPQMANAESLSEAFAAAYASNPTLISERARLRATDENVPIARAGMLPNVSSTMSVGVTETSISGSPSGGSTTPSSIELTATQVFYDGGRTRNSIDSALAGVEAGRSRLVSTEQSILLDVVTAYADSLRDEEFASLAENNVRVIETELRTTLVRFDVGEVTQTDVSQAQARLARAESDLATSIGDLERSYQFYRRVVGSYPASLDPLPPIPALPETLPDAVREAQRQHPDIVAAQQDEIQARRDVAVAQGALLPTISLVGSAGYAEDQSLTQTNGAADVSAFLQVSVPLYQGGAAYADVRRSQALQSSAMASIREASRRVRESVENAWSDLTAARASVAASKGQIAAARLAFQGVREEAKLGARTTLDVLDAEQELLDAQSALIAAERDAYVASFELLAALGRLTINGIGVDTEIYDPSGNFDEVSRKRFGFRRDELTEWRSPFRP